MAKLTCNMISYTLRRTVDITVILPTVTIPESFSFGPKTGMGGNMPGPEFTSYIGKPKFPVLYLLHGMGNNHATWSGYTNVEVYAEERNMAVVMFSAENRSYVNHPNGDNFYDFIETELMDFIVGTFPVSPRPEDTYIAGLSMGGFGTLVHALNNPEKFAAFGAFSAAVSLNPAALFGGEEKEVDPKYDPKSLAKALHSKNRQFPRAYIACGEKDFLIADNTAFAKELGDYGVDVTWVTLPQYGHEWRFWDIQIEKFLDWLPRTDHYAQKKNRQI